MPWITPPERDDDGVNIMFSFIRMVSPENGKTVPAMTFSQIIDLLYSLHSQVTTETPAVDVLERCIDVFTEQNH